jgi:hypothetical protein
VGLKATPETGPLTLDAVRVDPDATAWFWRTIALGWCACDSSAAKKAMMVTYPALVLVTLSDVSVKLLFLDGRRD